MLSLPIACPRAIGGLAPVFTRPVWPQVNVLMTGAVLAPGTRTVTAMLRMMGRRAASDLQTSHRVRHRAVWSPLTASRLLLRRFVAVCIPSGVVVFGLEDPIERRRGNQRTAQGISRDPVRSSQAHGVTGRGLRWLGGLLLPPIAWAHRVWAWPLLTGRCPSERCFAPRGRRHQPLLERAWPLLRLVRRWWPGREVVWVADSRGAALAWLDQVARWSRGSVIPRLRLDAALSDPPPPRAPGQRGRPRLTGKRRPTLEAVWADAKTRWSPLTRHDGSGEGPRAVDGATDPAGWEHSGKPPGAIRWGLRRDPQERCTTHAVLSTHPAQTSEQMLAWCVRRWTMAVTCEEARAPLGMATQRPWNDRAIARATPALLRRSSIMTLTAPLLLAQGAPGVRSPAGYGTTRPTFADAMALVRRQLWDHLPVSTSPQETDRIKIPRALLERFTEALCYAA